MLVKKVPGSVENGGCDGPSIKRRYGWAWDLGNGYVNIKLKMSPCSRKAWSILPQGAPGTRAVLVGQPLFKLMILNGHFYPSFWDYIYLNPVKPGAAINLE